MWTNGRRSRQTSIDEIGYETPAEEKQTIISLKKGDEIAIWSDMDLSFEGEVQIGFVVKISKGNEVVESLNFSPFKKNITVGEIKTSLGNKTDWSFEGKNAEFKVPEDGDYTF